MCKCEPSLKMLCFLSLHKMSVSVMCSVSVKVSVLYVFVWTLHSAQELGDPLCVLCEDLEHLFSSREPKDYETQGQACITVSDLNSGPPALQPSPVVDTGTTSVEPVTRPELHSEGVLFTSQHQSHETVEKGQGTL